VFTIRTQLGRIVGGASAAALAICIVATGASTAHATSATASASSCGTITIPASRWLGGNGVHVRSNGADEGSDYSCAGGFTYVHGVVAGYKWQCVELVNRLYLARGWTHTTWGGDAGAPFWNATPAGLVKQANGRVAYLGPGDVVDLNVFYNGKSMGGHVFVVNTGHRVRSGTVGLVSQNNSGVASKPGSIRNGTVTVSGSGGGWSYHVIGVIHAP
jgi:hypothetical protein